MSDRRPQSVHILWTVAVACGVRVEIRGAEKLSLRERQVVVLKESGLSNEAVARRLGVAPSTVATLFNRAKAKGYEVVIVLPGDALGLFAPDEEGEEPA